MVLSKKKREEIIEKFKIHENDTGSPEVQAALMTERLNGLAKHFEDFGKNHHSRRGLLRLVGQRRRLLNYLKKEDSKRYEVLIEKLGLRR